jgi:hypothetical protein
VDFSWTTFLGSLVGGGVTAWGVVKGLSGHLGERWLARYKSELDKEFEKYRDALEQGRKRMEAQLGHRTYVSKTQFDTEFSAIKDCFAALGKLRLIFNGLRPFLDWTPQDEDAKLKLIVARLNSFKERFNPFVDAMQCMYPFLPEDIFEQFEICSKSAFLEIRDIEGDISRALTSSGYDRGRKNHERFDTAYFAAAKLARQRFQQLSIASD